MTTVRSLLIAWGVSAVVLVVGLYVLLAGGGTVGVVLFVLGALGSIMTTFFMLRLRAGEAGDRRRGAPE